MTVHETGRSKLEFVPYYIPHHNEPPRLAGFLRQVERDSQTGDWSEPVRVVNLGEEAITRLLQVLEEHAAVAQRGAAGEFVLIPVERGVANLGTLDPATVAGAVAAFLCEPDVVERLAAEDLGVLVK